MRLSYAVLHLLRFFGSLASRNGREIFRKKLTADIPEIPGVRTYKQCAISTQHSGELNREDHQAQNRTAEL